MNLHRITVQLRYTLRHRRVLQIAVMLGFWILGEGLVHLTEMPIPGGIVGMAIVLTLLSTHRISAQSIGRGANWLITEMLLFFVPAVMVVLDHRELLSIIGVKLAAIIVVGTVLIMSGTALTVEFCQRWRMRHAVD